MPYAPFDQFPLIAERLAAALPQTTNEKLFSVLGGRVMLTSIVGEVTTVIQTQANNTKLTFDPAGVGTSIDLCSVLNISAKAVGIQLSIVGVLATALKGTSIWCVVPADNIPAPGIILGPGDILLDCAASNTGAIKWTASWYPIDSGGNLFQVAH